MFLCEELLILPHNPDELYLGVEPTLNIKSSKKRRSITGKFFEARDY